MKIKDCFSYGQKGVSRQKAKDLTWMCLWQLGPTNVMFSPSRL